VEVTVLQPGGTPATLVLTDKSGMLRDGMKKAGVKTYDNFGMLMNCGGGGNCGTCTVAVLEGGELLSEETEAEQKHLRRKGKPASWRLACQTCAEDGKVGEAKVQALPQTVK